jgi:metallophosphoesterase (TIGR00282 family)
VGIVNAMGRIFMGDLLDCPFRAMDKLIAEDFAEVDLIFLDFHAEATSEKSAMGHYLDGRVAVMVGTHTHVQTADERIMASGLAYISDVGMCGPRDSVIGVQADAVVEKFLSGRPTKFEVASGPPMINGVVIDCDPAAKKAVAIQRINRVYE